MTFHQRIFALSLGIGIFIVILELVRRRKLDEDDSFLWLITGLGIVVLVLWQDLLQWLTNLIGAKAQTTTLFIFGIVIVIFINLYTSVKMTKLNRQVKDLAQQVALSKINENRKS